MTRIDIFPKNIYRWPRGQQMKKWSASLIIRKMQSKITMRYMTPITITIFKKKKEILSIGKNIGEMGNLMHYWWKCKLVQSLRKT